MTPEDTGSLLPTGRRMRGSHAPPESVPDVTSSYDVRGLPRRALGLSEAAGDDMRKVLAIEPGIVDRHASCGVAGALMLFRID